MSIRADRDWCMGSGMCVLTAPEVFTQDDADGRVVLLTEDPPEGAAESVAEAVANCPAGALSLENP
jgi:ferredoxin